MIKMDKISTAIKEQYKTELFKERLQKREIWINSQIDDSVVEYLYMNLLKMQEDSQIDPITVVVNSRGGLMFESSVATDLMGTMRNKCKTIALGKALSGGFSIFMGGSERICHDFTCLMMHDAAFGVMDKRSNVAEYTKYLEYVQEKNASFFSKQTDGRTTPGYWMDLFNSGKEKWFTIEEALDLNIVHKVIRRPSSGGLVSRRPFTWDAKDFQRAQQ